MKTIYLFSGLGADRRAFAALDLSGFETYYIDWIAPLANETIAGYARRIATQITSPSPILVGLSFGGMMALEVARHVVTEKVILISSAKGKREIPHYYRWMAHIGLHRLMPSAQITKANRLLYWLFGTENTNERKLLAAILNDTDPVFFKWAIRHIGLWDNQHVPPNTLHIHGTNDRVLPYRFVKADHVIQGGGHMMVVNHAKIISEIIGKYCNE